MDKFNINDYVKGVQEPLKDIIIDAYYTVYEKHGFGDWYSYDMDSYFNSRTFKKYGVTENIPEISGYSKNRENKIKLLNDILNLTFNIESLDEDDPIEDLKNLPNGVGESYKDLNLNSKKIGNYDLNIIKHQQDRINSYCDEIKTKKTIVSNDQVERYFLIKFTLQAMESKINNQIKKIKDTVSYPGDSNLLRSLVDFIKSQTNDGKDLEALKKFNIDSEEELNKLSGKISIRDLGKDKLEKIKSSEGFNFKGLSYSNFSKEILENKSTTLDIRELIHLTNWKDGYFALENGIKEATRKEWLIKFGKGEYDPEKNHEEIKAIDEEFANILKNAFEPMKKLKEILEQEGKTAVEKLKSISEAKLFEEGSPISKLRSTCKKFKLDKEPNNTFKKISDLVNEVQKEVLISINNLDFIDLNTDEKINLLEGMGSSYIAKTLSLACEIKRALTDKMPNVATIEQKVKYFGELGIDKITKELKYFGQQCEKYKIEDKITPLFNEFQKEYDKSQKEKENQEKKGDQNQKGEDQEKPKIDEEDQKEQPNLKEFLASFDFEKFCFDKTQPGFEEYEYDYDSIKTNYSNDVADTLTKIITVKNHKFDLSKLRFDAFDKMKSGLKDYVNLYKNTFKDDLESLGEDGEKINTALEDLAKKIDQVGDNKSKAIAVGQSILFCIGTLCTCGILAFALLNKDVKNTILTPLRKVELAKIKNTCNEIIKNVQDLNKKIRDKSQEK